MSDICGVLEWPKLGVGARYRRWFKENLEPAFTVNYPDGTSKVLLTADDCYELRCAMLHSGSDDIDPKNADSIVKFHFNTIGAHVNRINDTLTLDVAGFCKFVADGVDAWSAKVAQDADIQARIATRAEVKIGSFQPIPGFEFGKPSTVREY
jgi:hypothetical protein